MSSGEDEIEQAPKCHSRRTTRRGTAVESSDEEEVEKPPPHRKTTRQGALLQQQSKEPPTISDCIVRNHGRIARVIPAPVLSSTIPAPTSQTSNDGPATVLPLRPDSGRDRQRPMKKGVKASFEGKLYSQVLDCLLDLCFPHAHHIH
jgi:hypothetical protein